MLVAWVAVWVHHLNLLTFCILRMSTCRRVRKPNPLQGDGQPWQTIYGWCGCFVTVLFFRSLPYVTNKCFSRIAYGTNCLSTVVIQGTWRQVNTVGSVHSTHAYTLSCRRAVFQHAHTLVRLLVSGVSTLIDLTSLTWRQYFYLRIIALVSTCQVIYQVYIPNRGSAERDRICLFKKNPYVVMKPRYVVMFCMELI